MYIRYILRYMTGVRKSQNKVETDDSQIGPHHDLKITPFRDLRFEEFSVINGLLRRMNGAGADDDKESIVISRQDPGRIVASRGNGLLGGRRRNDFVTEQSGLNKGVILE